MKRYGWWIIITIFALAGAVYRFPMGAGFSGKDIFFRHAAVYAVCDMKADCCFEKIVTVTQEQEQRENRIQQSIAAMISQMTLEQKLSQMMILTNKKDITLMGLQDSQPAGILLFSEDFNGKTMEQTAAAIRNFQSVMPIPLFVGIDEEGGEVARTAGLTDGTVSAFSGARQLYETGGTEAVREDTAKKSEFLAAMGINLNFAPVADVVRKKESYMYERSASGEPKEAAEYVEAVVGVMKNERMGSCLKHFPGYGENANTHQMYTVDEKALSVYREQDFLPFERGIAAGADMVMVSHIVMKAVDEKTPSSLSPAVHRLLRGELGFQGVIMADDLNMQAILSQMSLEEAAAMAFIAGNDMIFSADFKATMKGAQQAVREGRLSEEAIDASVMRILRMKMNLGLLTAPEE